MGPRCPSGKLRDQAEVSRLTGGSIGTDLAARWSNKHSPAQPSRRQWMIKMFPGPRNLQGSAATGGFLGPVTAPIGLAIAQWIAAHTAAASNSLDPPPAVGSRCTFRSLKLPKIVATTPVRNCKKIGETPDHGRCTDD
jgi:hypothetical protein